MLLHSQGAPTLLGLCDLMARVNKPVTKIHIPRSVFEKLKADPQTQDVLRYPCEADENKAGSIYGTDIFITEESRPLLTIEYATPTGPGRQYALFSEKQNDH